MCNTLPEFVCLLDAARQQSLAEEIVPLATTDALRGLSVGVKDLFHIAGLPTSAGNPDWRDSHPIPERSAWAVMQLAAAGAEIKGKTQTDELAYSLNGLNQHYPALLNPAAPDRLPGGSSNGSAVATAAGHVDVGLGTDTGGSIRVPASYNGLFGLRTSHGRVPRDGLVALAPRFDTVGWMTRDLAALQRVSKVMLPSNTRSRLDQVVILLPANVSSAWPTSARRLLERLAPLYRDVQLVDFPESTMTAISAAFRVLQGRDIWRQHGQWITHTQPKFAEDIAQRFAWCQSLTPQDEDQANQTAEQFYSFWQTDCGIHSKTMVVMPTTPGAAPLLNTAPQALAEYRNGLMGLTAPAGLLGAPQLSLPLLQDQQAPWGVSLLSAPGTDLALLAQAQRLSEQWVTQ